MSRDNGDFVVNEFESLEADHGGKGELQAQQFLKEYWKKVDSVHIIMQFLSFSNQKFNRYFTFLEL